MTRTTALPKPAAEVPRYVADACTAGALDAAAEAVVYRDEARLRVVQFMLARPPRAWRLAAQAGVHGQHFGRRKDLEIIFRVADGCGRKGRHDLRTIAEARRALQARGFYDPADPSPWEHGRWSHADLFRLALDAAPGPLSAEEFDELAGGWCRRLVEIARRLGAADRLFEKAYRELVGVADARVPTTPVRYADELAGVARDLGLPAPAVVEHVKQQQRKVG